MLLEWTYISVFYKLFVEVGYVLTQALFIWYVQ